MDQGEAIVFGAMFLNHVKEIHSNYHLIWRQNNLKEYKNFNLILNKFLSMNGVIFLSAIFGNHMKDILLFGLVSKDLPFPYNLLFNCMIPGNESIAFIYFNIKQGRFAVRIVELKIQN